MQQLGGFSLTDNNILKEKEVLQPFNFLKKKSAAKIPWKKNKIKSTTKYSVSHNLQEHQCSVMITRYIFFSIYPKGRQILPAFLLVLSFSIAIIFKGASNFMQQQNEDASELLIGTSHQVWTLNKRKWGIGCIKEWEISKRHGINKWSWTFAEMLMKESHSPCNNCSLVFVQEDAASINKTDFYSTVVRLAQTKTETFSC